MSSGQEPVTGDEGFSLLEILLALTILSITLLASTPFFVTSLTNVNKQRTKQGAIQLAATALEQVRALKGSALLSGRSVNATQTQFDAARSSVKSYLATMQVAGDPLITDSTSTAGSEAPIPTSARSLTLEGTTYTQNIYVGECEAYLTGTGECIYPLGSAAPTDTTKILKFFRVVVLETWSDKTCTNSSTSNTCEYIVSTLVSRAAEPTFDIHRPSPTVLTSSVTFYKGVATTYQLEARGGQLPNTWTVGKLPAGLSMTPAGVISGTPTTAGITVTTTTVTDKLSRSDTEAITFTVLLPPTLTMPSNASNHVGEAVSLQATAANGVSPYTYTASNLPPGLSINASTGAITGTVTTAGTYVVTVTATDANSVSGTGTYTHVVYAALTLGTLADQTIDLGSKLSLTAVGAGGDGSYTYTATGLPTGGTINKNTGAIAGKPTVTGRFLPTITVTDGIGGTASQQIVIIVNSSTSLVFTAPSLTSADQSTAKGTATSLTLTTNGSLLGLSPVLTISGLPTGLTLNATTGVISGTPTATGTYTVTATATTVTATSVLTFIWKIT
ncbi:putative Ig domain-containing protein [Actinoplanes sp. NPDC051851]|uniref:putative Ig domain-containing protein n=1 Tax=Actinoplanes sp. NPDC051851 TaxID=3154753 RepID=UPI00342EA546